MPLLKQKLNVLKGTHVFYMIFIRVISLFLYTYKIIVGIFDGSEHEHPYKGYGCSDGGQGGDSGDHLKHQQT